MKNLGIIIFILLVQNAKSQNKVGYFYDNNGNRYQRYFIGFRPTNQDSSQSTLDSLLNTPYNQNNSPTNPQEIADELGISVYPNPTLDLIFVKISKVTENKLTDLYLIDNFGRYLANKKYSGNETSFDLSNYPSGNYYLKMVLKDSRTITYNVIKHN
jgi:hypothetical protein